MLFSLSLSHIAVAAMVALSNIHFHFDGEEWFVFNHAIVMFLISIDANKIRQHFNKWFHLVCPFAHTHSKDSQPATKKIKNEKKEVNKQTKNPTSLN